MIGPPETSLIAPYDHKETQRESDMTTQLAASRKHPDLSSWEMEWGKVRKCRRVVADGYR